MENAARRNAPLVGSVVALACIALAVAPAQWIAALAYDRSAIVKGDIWRLWTGHLVHFSAQHAMADAAAFLLLAALAERDIGSRRLCIGVLLGAPFISLGLMLAVPDLLYYRGASGIATMVAVVAGASLWRTHPARRTLLAVLAAGFLLKTACEGVGIAFDASTLPSDVSVAWQAHAFGTLAGALLAVSVGVRSDIRTRAGPQTVQSQVSN